MKRNLWLKTELAVLPQFAAAASAAQALRAIRRRRARITRLLAARPSAP